MQQTDKSSWSLREILWNYPTFILRIFRGAKILFYFLGGIVTGVAIFWVFRESQFVNAFVPGNDGVLDEGTVGVFNTFNPIFTNQNHVDRDIHQLLYEKFIYINSKSEPEPGIATSWDLSSDGTIYTFTISDRYYWHDGERVTLDDVLFTFESAVKMAENNKYDTFGKSFLDVKFAKVSPNQIQFTLPNSSATFFEALAVFILPQHRFDGVDYDQFYQYGEILPPVGSGPFQLTQYNKNRFLFSRFDKHPANIAHRGDQYIQRLNYNVFPTVELLETSFKNGLIDTISNMSQNDTQFIKEYKEYALYSKVVPIRKKLIYMNLSDLLLAQADLRKALSYFVDKKQLLSDAKVDGEVAFNPFPSNSWAFDSSTDIYSYNPEEGHKVLAALNYTRGEDGLYRDQQGNILSLEIKFLGNTLNGELAQSLKELYQKEGVELILAPTTYESLLNEVLATRDFQLLLFEIETGSDPDQYNLWHSSKVNFPDLNVAGYNYIRTDFFLEQGRTSLDRNERIESYKRAQGYIVRDIPALILYEPRFNYVVSRQIDGVELLTSNYPYERFHTVSSWTWVR